MSVVGILGSGFGLYGYLPAMIEAGAERIVLPVRYKAKLLLRPELRKYSDYVQWVFDECAVLETADSVVVALRPNQQAQWVAHSIKLSNLTHLLLEKPLAICPYEASLLLDNLVISNKIFRIGYNFRFTTWGMSMLHTLCNRLSVGELDSLSICWNFLAHHHSNNAFVWKRYTSKGGGALRFYGIHLIALLAELKYTEVLFSKTFGPSEDEIVKWTCKFSGKNLPECEVTVNTKARSNQFLIEHLLGFKKKTLVNQPDPFDFSDASQMFNGLDKRVSYLAGLGRTLFADPEKFYGWYRDTIILWQRIEDCDSFEECES